TKSTAVLPLDPSRNQLLTSLYGAMTLEVLDGDAFNRLVDEGATSLLQNGASVAKSAAVKSADFCFFESSGGRASFKTGDRIACSIKLADSKLTGVGSVDYSFQMGCARESGSFDSWSLRDLDRTLGGVVKADPSN